MVTFQVMRLLGGWLAKVPEYELKLEIGRHVWQDAQAAHIVGAKSLLLRSPWIGKGHHDFVLSNLSELVQKIQQLHSASILLMHQP